MTPETNNQNHWLPTRAAILLSLASWVGAHIGPISGGFAILAALFSMRASTAAKKLSEDQFKNPWKYNLKDKQ